MAAHTQSNPTLSEVNSTTLGVKMPEVTLPDGTKVQTGTIGTLLVNIKAYNVAYAAGDKEKMAGLEISFRPAMGLLDRAGMFDLFTPEEWIKGDNPGRRVVGQMFQEFKAEQAKS